MSDNSLVHLGDLTKPATVLIEKISDAVGGLFKPYQIIRVANAEAEADRLRAASQIQVTDLHRRAMHRFLEEEAKRQSNIEGITQKALPLLNENSLPQDVESDWITNFFDKCRIVSDEDMQRLWSRILAAEANEPGVFSRRTVNLLADLDKSDAELFTSLCGFVFIIDASMAPLVFDIHGEIYNRKGINFGSLGHMESLGLIKFDNFSQFRLRKRPKKSTARYYGRMVELTFPNDADNELRVGTTLLTRAGHELLPVCCPTPVDGFFELVCERWEAQSLVANKAPEANAPDAAGRG